VAKDLRLRVYQMIREGQSEQEIVAFMTDRFGEFVRYAPVLSKNTYLLWFTPLLLLVIGFIWAILLVKRQRR
jgi:cytochrome c-type biogenesis protein CcmH